MSLRIVIGILLTLCASSLQAQIISDMQHTKSLLSEVDDVRNHYYISSDIVFTSEVTSINRVVFDSIVGQIKALTDNKLSYRNCIFRTEQSGTKFNKEEFIASFKIAMSPNSTETNLNLPSEILLKRYFSKHCEELQFIGVFSKEEKLLQLGLNGFFAKAESLILRLLAENRNFKRKLGVFPGATKVKSNQGPAGSLGATGNLGATVATRASGQNGGQGPAVAVGATGTKGATGPASLSGAKSPTKNSGPAGPQGSIGSENHSLPDESEMPNESGKCYAKCLIADQYETITEQILTKEATSSIEIVPAVYKDSVITAVTIDTSAFQGLCDSSTIRAAITEVLVKDTHTKIEKQLVKYETRTEQIESAPASTKWVKKKADKNCLSADPNDCLVWCLEETPAQYRTVTMEVRVPCPEGYYTEGGDCLRKTTIPAIYRSVISPSSTKELLHNCPSLKLRLDTIVVSQLVSPTYTRSIDVPAEYKTVTRRELIKKGGFTEWKEVLCEKSITPPVIDMLAKTLYSRGYKIDIDGSQDMIRSDTRKALIKFQKDNGLPIGQMDLETLAALGLH